jgi:hypothetical protein
VDASLATPLALLELSVGGPGRDVLTLCASSSQERRDWIVHLKARLRGRDLAALSSGLNRMYLQPDPEDRLAALDAAAGGM